MTHKARIFMNGRSQAVRLPRTFRFDVDEVFVRRQGEDVVLSPRAPVWDEFFAQPSAFGEEYLEDRDQPEVQERDF